MYNAVKLQGIQEPSQLGGHGRYHVLQETSETSTQQTDSYCEALFRKACRTRHLITWLLVGSLLAGVAVFLFVYAAPLVEKAHNVTDEALSITTLARDKLEGIDKQVAEFLQAGNEKLVEVGKAATAVQALTERMHQVLTSLEETNTAMQTQLLLQETPSPSLREQVQETPPPSLTEQVQEAQPSG